MPRDTSWEDVWAEYDARQAGHAAPPPAAAPARTEAPRPRRPNRLALGGLLALLVVLLGLPFGDAGAPAVASQEQAFQRHTMIAVGLSGETDMGESPAVSPPPAMLLAEAVLLPMPPPAWVQPSATPAAEPAAPAAARAAAHPTRRVARARRVVRQLVAAEAAAPWPTIGAAAPRRASLRAAPAGATLDLGFGEPPWQDHAAGRAHAPTRAARA